MSRPFDDNVSEQMKQSRALDKSIVDLRTISGQQVKPFPNASSSLLVTGFTITLWLSLLLELCYFFLQADTSNDGAKDAEERIGDEVAQKPIVEWLTRIVMYVAATGDLYTNVWGVSPKYDTPRLVYDESSRGNVDRMLVVSVMKWLFYACAVPSYAVGAAANWLGPLPLISSENDTDKIYFERNSALLFICVVAGMIYYFANARLGFAKTINTVVDYFYPGQPYPVSTNRYFFYGAYLRGAFAVWESLRTVLVRSLSFLALFDLLYQALRLSWIDEAKTAARIVIFATTAVVVVLSRLAVVVTQWISPEYANLTDAQKLEVMGNVTIKDVIFNKHFIAEAITSAGVYLFGEFFIDPPAAAALTVVYLALSYTAVRDLRICTVAKEFLEADPRSSIATRTSSVFTETKSSFAVAVEDEEKHEEKSVSAATPTFPVTDPEKVKKIRKIAVENFAATFSQDVLTRCNIGCALRVFARSFQLIGFVKDTADRTGLTLPLYGTLLGIATAVMRNEFFFFRGNMIEYQTLDAVAAYLIYCSKADREVSFKEWYSISNWRLQLKLIKTGVDDFTIEQLIQAMEKRYDELNTDHQPQNPSCLDRLSSVPAAMYGCFASVKVGSNLEERLISRDEFNRSNAF